MLKVKYYGKVVIDTPSKLKAFRKIFNTIDEYRRIDSETEVIWNVKSVFTHLKFYPNKFSFDDFIANRLIPISRAKGKLKNK